MIVSNIHPFKVMTKAHMHLLLLSFLFLLVSCGPPDDSVGGSGSSEVGSQSGSVDIYDSEVNGTFVTCSRVYEVDVSAWPSEGYPIGASGTYRYVSEDRFDGPTDGKMPDGVTTTGFTLSRKGYDELWTIMSISGIDGTSDGYPWDHQASATDCPDGNSSWNNGSIVKAP
ncbi:MAG: hypothetical protein CMI26_00335 [Opitutae bacterium]|jgi:hypothetical protein|nr:hypothetical protein [Opitutae bacterium]|tara:strand:- start:2662 stop:3171 length:510 start_codon:yes stop_codon:yes gene_type:complete